jgi:RES domain-containing protein
MIAYRLCGTHRDPRDATGATRRGGRWNSPGIPILYCASSLSLACLECLVHIRSTDIFPSLNYAQITIPEDEVSLWSQTEARTDAILTSLVLSREVGDDWIRHRPGPLSKTRTGPAVLQVPSVVIPQEWNCLINPASPNSNKLVWSEPRPFRFDPRLISPERR